MIGLIRRTSKLIFLSEDAINARVNTNQPNTGTDVLDTKAEMQMLTKFNILLNSVIQIWLTNSNKKM